MTARTFVLELEERLHADRSGELQRRLLERLEALQQKLLAQRRSLNRPATYREIQAATRAVEGAMHALRTLRIQRE